MPLRGIYTKDSLLRLRDRIDLVDVLSRHVDLKRSGAVFKGLCPFHEEKTPSFMIKRGDRHYHCFGCGAHGDAISFLMDYHHLSFKEAVEDLASQFDVRLEVEKEEATAGPDKNRLKEALAMASAFFTYVLFNSREGASALAYLNGRGLTNEFLKKYEVGLAPRNPLLFAKVMKRKGFDLDILESAGLLTRDKRPFFRERVTFPIKNRTGAIIGFSARKYLETTFGGKYINSPETALFKKSRTLFGYNYSRARIAKEHQALIVEGQIDCLRLIDAGFDYTVSSLGTAFTEDHVLELKNLGVTSATLLFDGDKSGQEAALKVGHLFQKQGIGVLVAVLEAGEDPDSTLRKGGVEKLQECLSKVRDYLAFYVDLYSKRGDIALPSFKTELIREIAAHIQAWDDPVMVHESLKRLAHLTQVPEALIMERKSRPKKSHLPTAPAILSVQSPRVLEEEVLFFLIHSTPDEQKLIVEHLSRCEFQDSDCQELFQALLKAINSKEPIDHLSLLAEVQRESAFELFESIFNRKSKKKIGIERIREALQRLLDRKWLLERERIQKEIAKGNKSEGELMELVKLFDQLKNERPKI